MTDPDCPGLAQLAAVLERLEAKVDNLLAAQAPKVMRATVCTPAQADVLRAFHRLTRVDYRPTLQDVADELGRSTSWIHKVTEKLARRGLMERQQGNRGWQVTEKAAPLLDEGVA